MHNYAAISIAILISPQANNRKRSIIVYPINAKLLMRFQLNFVSRLFVCYRDFTVLNIIFGMCRVKCGFRFVDHL